MSLALPLPQSLGAGGGGISPLIQQFDSNVKITDLGSTARITADLNGVEVLRINNDGKIGIGTNTINTKNLEINDPLGKTLRLIYNDSDGSPANYSDICVDSTGQLLLLSSGNDVKIDTTNNLDIVSHNGNNKGLKLGGSIVCATAQQLNYNCITTTGIAQPSHTLVTDSNNNITGLNSLNVGTLNVTTFNVTNFAITGLVSNFAEGGLVINAYSGINMNGRLIQQSVETTLNFNNFNPNSQTDNFSLEIIGYIKPEFTETYTFYTTADDGDRLWVNNELIHNNWIGTTNDEPSITINLIAEQWYPIRIHTFDNIGTQKYILNWESASQVKSSIPAIRMAWDNTENNINISPLRTPDEILIYNSNTNSNIYGSIVLSNTGVLNLDSNTNNIDIVGHNGVDKGLHLNGILITSTSAELNILDGVTSSTAEINILDGVTSSTFELNILDGITSSTAELNILTGVLADSSEINILDGVTSSTAELNYLDLTNGSGTGEANKTLVLDGSRNISNINILTAETGCFSLEDGVENTTLYPLKIRRTTSITPANDLGVGMIFELENSNNTNIIYGSIKVNALNITDTSENGKMVLSVMNNGTLTERAILDELGQLSVTNVIETSDVRVKENFQDADLFDSFIKIQQIKLKDYNFIDDPNKKIKRGVIAQQLKEIIPAAVEISKMNGYDDFHSVSNRELLSHLIASVQYIIKKIDIE